MPAIMNRKYAMKSSNKSKWRASNFIRDMDNFGKEVPSFNVRGETHINTIPGGLLNLLVLIVTLGYAIGKFAELYTRDDPNITYSLVPDFYGTNDGFTFADKSFRLAIGGRDNGNVYTGPADDKIFDHDSRYVRWIARIRN